MVGSQTDATESYIFSCRPVSMYGQQCPKPHIPIIVIIELVLTISSKPTWSMEQGRTSIKSLLRV